MKFKEIINKQNISNKEDWMKSIKKKYPKATFDRNNYPDLIAFCKGNQIGFWDNEDKEGTIN